MDESLWKRENLKIIHFLGEKTTTERDTFLRKLKKLDRGEVSTAFTVTFTDIISVMGVEIPCVGCR